MKEFLGQLLDFIDPERKGPFCWRYGWKGLLFIAVLTAGLYGWFIGPRHCPLAGIFWFFTIGIHEAGHPIFRFLTGGNFFWTIWGGTLMEVGVPLFAFFWFLHRGQEIQADGCLLLLAIAFYSVGQYTGCSLDPVISLLNAGPETLPDWDYMHKWLGTEGYEWHMRRAFYLLSALTTAVGIYLFAVHTWDWTNPDKRRFSEMNRDGLDRFFYR